MTQQIPVEQIIPNPEQPRQGLERVYGEIRAWGIDPLAGEGADK